MRPTGVCRQQWSTQRSNQYMNSLSHLKAAVRRINVFMSAGRCAIAFLCSFYKNCKVCKLIRSDFPTPLCDTSLSLADQACLSYLACFGHTPCFWSGQWNPHSKHHIDFTTLNNPDFQKHINLLLQANLKCVYILSYFSFKLSSSCCCCFFNCEENNKIGSLLPGLHDDTEQALSFSGSWYKYE